MMYVSAVSLSSFLFTVICTQLMVKISIAQRFRRAAVSVAGSQNRINIQHFIINASVLLFDPCFSLYTGFFFLMSSFIINMNRFLRNNNCVPLVYPPPRQMKVSKDTKNVIILVVTGILGGG